MPEIIKGILEQKDLKNITFEYDAKDEILIFNVQVTPGIVTTLSKNMTKPKEKLTFPSLMFMESFVNIFE